MTLTDLSNRYMASIGRVPVPGELVEFVRLFKDANLGVLERAIDDYLRSNPDFPKLTALWSVYARRSPDKKGDDEDTYWLKSKKYELFGFRHCGGGQDATPSEIRKWCAQHANAKNDLTPQWMLDKGVRPGVLDEEALPKMKAAEERLRRAGYVRDGA